MALLVLTFTWIVISYVNFGRKSAIFTNYLVHNIKNEIKIVPVGWWPYTRYVIVNKDLRYYQAIAVVSDTLGMNEEGKFEVKLKLYSGEEITGVISKTTRCGMHEAEYGDSEKYQFQIERPYIYETNALHPDLGPVIGFFECDPLDVFNGDVVNIAWRDQELVEGGKLNLEKYIRLARNEHILR